MAIPEGSDTSCPTSTAAPKSAGQQLHQQASDDEEKCLLTPTSLPGCAFSQVFGIVFVRETWPFLKSESDVLARPEEEDGDEAQESGAQQGMDCSPSPQQFFLSPALIYSEPALPSALLANGPPPVSTCHWAYSDMHLPQVFWLPIEAAVDNNGNLFRVVPMHWIRAKRLAPDWAVRRKARQGQQRQSPLASSPKVSLPLPPAHPFTCRTSNPSPSARFVTRISKSRSAIGHPGAATILIRWILRAF